MDSSTGCPAWRNECHSHSQPQLSLANCGSPPRRLRRSTCERHRSCHSKQSRRARRDCRCQCCKASKCMRSIRTPSFIRTPQRYETWTARSKFHWTCNSMQLDATRCNHKKKMLFSYVSPKRPSAPDAWLVFHLQFHER